MSLPSNVDFGTVVGTIIDSTGTPAKGKVTFTPAAKVLINRTASPPVTITTASVKVELDADGHFSVQLVATDDPDLNPVGWTYSMSFVLEAGTIASESILVPVGATIDVTTVVRVTSSGGTPITQGPPGDLGPPGPPNVLSIGTVTGSATATASITGTSPDQTLNLGLPQGEVGPPGPPADIRTYTSGMGWTLSRIGRSVTITLANAAAPITIPTGYRPSSSTPGVLSASTGMWLAQSAGSTVTVLGPAAAGATYTGSVTWTTTEAMPA